MQFNVDTNATIVLANKLELLSRSALPNAVRGTLNAMAIDVKKNTMPDEVQDNFIQRNKTFFRSRSKVNFAKGFKLELMQSEVGFYSRGDKDEQAVEDLEKQEIGGKIKGRSFLPTSNVRVSKSQRKQVQKAFRLSKIKEQKIIYSEDYKGNLPAAVFVAKEKGLVIHQGMLYFVDKTNWKSKGDKFKLIALYSYKSGRDVQIKHATHFMEKASEKTYSKAVMFFEREFEREAERQFNRVWR